ELSFLSEYDHVTLAKVLIAQYRADRRRSSIGEAMHLLERLLDAADAGERAGSAIDVLITQATGYATQDDDNRAINALERALKLAEPEGHVRPFTDEGQVMRALLLQAVSRGVAPAYAEKLLAD